MADIACYFQTTGEDNKPHEATSVLYILYGYDNRNQKEQHQRDSVQSKAGLILEVFLDGKMLGCHGAEGKLR